MAASDRLVLVVNAGSSSLKFKLFTDAAAGLRGAVSGLVERIGDVKNSRIITTELTAANPEKTAVDRGVKDHTTALDYVLQHLKDTYAANIADNMEAVGHRVVHGRDIPAARLVDDGVMRVIQDAAPLAPLHNPANLEGIRAASAVFSCPQVAVFDTAYLTTMPPAAYTYALPAELAKREGLRRYGAHGTSYRFLVGAAAKMLGRPAAELNLIIGHIGAGASMSAVRKGSVVDTSMGLTPLEGLMMGTRCGDIDPSVVVYLAQHCNMSIPAVDKLMNKQSGFLGLAGNADLRSVVAAADSGDAQAKLAIEVFIHRLRKYLGAYLIELEGATDAIVFSAGIGENNPMTRRLCLKGLEAFGIEVDDAKNEAAIGGKSAEIQTEDSRVKILVIPTDEELSIAQQTLEVVNSHRPEE